MTLERFLMELRQARLDNCPVTVETIERALEQLVDPTNRSDDQIAVGIMRGRGK